VFSEEVVLILIMILQQVGRIEIYSIEGKAILHQLKEQIDNPD
jgi:hypothetical protein